MQPDITPCDGVGRMTQIVSARLVGTNQYQITYQCPECSRDLQATTTKAHPSERIRVRAHARKAA